MLASSFVQSLAYFRNMVKKLKMLYMPLFLYARIEVQNWHVAPKIDNVWSLKLGLNVTTMQ